MKTKYIISDVDGVILDRMPIYRKAFVQVLKPFGVSEKFAARHYYDTAGSLIIDQIYGIMKIFNCQFGRKEDTQILVDRFFSLAGKEEAGFFPGVVKVYNDLYEQGIRFFATSGSNTKEICDRLKKEKLKFDLILGSDQIPKGDEHIRMFAEYLGVEVLEFCKSAVFIGDGPGDMELAKRNNIFSVGIINTVSKKRLIDAGAFKVILEINEFSEIIKSINKGGKN